MEILEAIEVKECCHCHVEKPVTDFNLKNKVTGKRQSRCKPCQAIVSREHYLANKEKIIERSAINAAARRVSLEKIVKEGLAAAKCEKCGTANQLTYHLNRDFDGPCVSAILHNGMARESLMEAIEHSSILCKSCQGATFHKGLEPYLAARRAGQPYEAKRTPKNEYKSRYTKANKDRRMSSARV
ncbi:ABC transporter ATP-binding protein [Novimethylophilus kurashikiensis]|uniref:ABC transporter ATP-binding protein n=1 Tax=Novimethylophilus kurashikiensis TaxID=1825523 RepID=A0A2R5F981_9PROT|nr:hypothetical protein [Novimethylophilus kurashikiensis]GBG14379.1 ABC transporter ATP-binding protein [Novimethylophilus kurashikiensis]